MSASPDKLRADALAIWHAGVDAVRSDRLVKDNVRVEDDLLIVGDESLVLSSIGRIAIVGTGKAGAGMAAGLEEALGQRVMAEKQVAGWINVPADCVRKPGRIHLHAARPPGVNEPTAEGAIGGERILEIVQDLGPADLCLCLISGGGSALLPAPARGVPLAEKQALTRLLSGEGANIQELNTVRKQLSRIKGGGLARACGAGRLIALIISDVLGDPLDVIASGPTVLDTSTPQDAVTILERFSADERIAPAAIAFLRRQVASGATPLAPKCQVTNLIIGNNAVAVDAAGMEAERRGYAHAMHAASDLEGPAEEIGVHLARMAMQMRGQPGPNCLITGGEPTVKLAPPEIRGKGGRNQQVALAALVELISVQPTEGGRAGQGSLPDSVLSTQYSVPSTEHPGPPLASNPSAFPAIALLSGGTDGEDGPTDAAGAVIDSDIVAVAKRQSLDPADFLRRNDAYHFFEATGGLIKTGPTHTNVCDVRVVVVDRVQSA